MQYRIVFTVLASILVAGGSIVQAAPISGQGTWETTLQGRLETAPGSGVFQAYYDTHLDITWAANANINGNDTWDNQVAWAAGSVESSATVAWKTDRPPRKVCPRTEMTLTASFRA